MNQTPSLVAFVLTGFVSIALFLWLAWDAWKNQRISVKGNVISTKRSNVIAWVVLMMGFAISIAFSILATVFLAVLSQINTGLS